MSHPFVPFGSSHLAVITLTLLLPLALSLLARHEHLGRHADRMVRVGLAGLLAIGWLCWYGLSFARGTLTPDNSLPMNLCDWADLILIVALLTRQQFAYELGYFWGLGGTLQGVLTPTIYWDFPDPQFLFFFIQHGGVVAALLYLTLGTRLRPTFRSLPRVVAASLAYLAVAASVDWLLGVNYGFLRARPAGQNLMTMMSPWPWYIPELAAMGVVFILVYYAPFALLDVFKGQKNMRRPAHSRRSRLTSAPLNGPQD
ncbi:MAG: TIGR02206 family membrane protein [Alphaproteobacteria bacterium]|nr:TIGR02206 family membrane protein [Alphaproteobacteria bacterium]